MVEIYKQVKDSLIYFEVRSIMFQLNFSPKSENEKIKATNISKFQKTLVTINSLIVRSGHNFYRFRINDFINVDIFLRMYLLCRKNLIYIALKGYFYPYQNLQCLSTNFRISEEI